MGSLFNGQPSPNFSSISEHKPEDIIQKLRHRFDIWKLSSLARFARLLVSVFLPLPKKQRASHPVSPSPSAEKPLNPTEPPASINPFVPLFLIWRRRHQPNHHHGKVVTSFAMRLNMQLIRKLSLTPSKNKNAWLLRGGQQGGLQIFI